MPRTKRTAAASPAQLVGADRAARHDDGVVVIGGDLVEGLVDGEGLAGSRSL